MRMSDEEYFRTCVAKERQLAHLLGHHNIEELYEDAGTLWDGAQALPKWTRDWNACGPLIAAYDIALAFDSELGEPASSFVTVGPVEVRFSDHPSKDRAVMFAIVKALIFQLEHAGRTRFA